MKKLLLAFLLVPFLLSADYIVIVRGTIDPTVYTTPQDLDTRLKELEGIPNVSVGIVVNVYSWERVPVYGASGNGTFYWVMKYEERTDDQSPWETKHIAYAGTGSGPTEAERTRWSEDATSIDKDPNQRLIDQGCLYYLEESSITTDTKIKFIIP